jgi:hypothetical protein
MLIPSGNSAPANGDDLDNLPNKMRVLKESDPILKDVLANPSLMGQLFSQHRELKKMPEVAASLSGPSLANPYNQGPMQSHSSVPNFHP